MKRSKPIQISIPNPCHEDWNKMTLAEQGRFCSHCQKVVTDFTSYTDAQLYQFFNDRNKQVCGRFYSHQLNTSISIPPQPHSRLYRYFIGLGLTLFFTQLPESNLRAQTPHTYSNPYNADDTPTGNNSHNTFIKGTVIDEDKKPIIGALVELSNNRETIATTFTDEDGNYQFAVDTSMSLKCRLTFKYSKYTTKAILNPPIHEGQTTVVNAEMEKSRVENDNNIIWTGTPAIIDRFEPNKTVITSEDIERMAH